MATAYKFSETETSALALAAAGPKLAETLASGAADIAESAKPLASDEEVITWLEERGVAGPFSIDFLDKLRDAVARQHFVDLINEIRPYPDKMLALAAKYREIGLDTAADGIDELRIKDAERLAAWRANAGLTDRPDVYILPDFPTGMSNGMTVIAHKYRTYFLADAPNETDEEYDRLSDLTYDAVVSAEKYVPRNFDDLAAKMMIGIHYADPTRVGARLAIDTNRFNCPSAAQVLTSALTAMAEMASQPVVVPGAFAAAWTEFSSCSAAELALPGDTLEQEKAIDLASDKTMAAFDRLNDIPAATVGEAIQKLDAIEIVYDAGAVPPLASALAELRAAYQSAALPRANRHSDWLAERNEVFGRANRAGSDEETASIMEECYAIEGRILDTEASSVDEACSKLRLIVQNYDEGSVFSEAQMYAALEDVCDAMDASRPATMQVAA